MQSADNNVRLPIDSVSQLGAAHPFQWNAKHFAPVSAAAYSAIQQFLVFESLLLDHGRYADWLRLIAGNAVYRVHKSASVEREPEGLSDCAFRDHGKLRERVNWLVRQRGPVGGSDVIRTRRFLTNISVSCHRANEYEVCSYLRVEHILEGGRITPAWGGERRDRLRIGSGTFVILQRELVIDAIAAGISRLPEFP
jgi:3-phenylpropionate/cinnamic acid dioxygenase small subunit